VKSGSPVGDVLLFESCTGVAELRGWVPFIEWRSLLQQQFAPSERAAESTTVGGEALGQCAYMADLTWSVAVAADWLLLSEPCTSLHISINILTAAPVDWLWSRSVCPAYNIGGAMLAARS
jgi:hypothetical protein